MKLHIWYICLWFYMLLPAFFTVLYLYECFPHSKTKFIFSGISSGWIFTAIIWQTSLFVHFRWAFSTFYLTLTNTKTTWVQVPKRMYELIWSSAIDEIVSPRPLRKSNQNHPSAGLCRSAVLIYMKIYECFNFSLQFCTFSHKMRLSCHL